MGKGIADAIWFAIVSTIIVVAIVFLGIGGFLGWLFWG